MMCLPIIRYTHIRDMQDSHSVSVEMFEKHIRYLQKHSYVFLNLDDVLELKSNPKALPSKCILLTFDGAWRDIYDNAYQILKHYWVKAGLFVVTEWVDEASKLESAYKPVAHTQCTNMILQNARAVMCNWAEIQEMQDVFSIGSMTHTYQLSNIISLSWHDDFELSRRLIQEKFGVETRHLAWPGGSYNQGLLRTAKSMGYEVFYTMENGLNMLEESYDALKRYQAQNSLFWLKKMLFASSSARNFRIGKIFL